jgi:hypothetical protein
MQVVVMATHLGKKVDNAADDPIPVVRFLTPKRL